MTRLTTRAFVLLLLTFVSSPVVLAQSAPRGVDTLTAQIQDYMTRLEALAIRYGEAEGEERLVIDQQQLKLAESAIETLLELGDAIELAESQGRDVSEARVAIGRALATGMRYTRRDVTSSQRELDEVRRERGTAPPNRLLSIERRLTGVDAELDQHLSWILRLAGLRERLGIDAAEDYAYLDRLLEERSGRLRAQIEVTLRRDADVKERQASGDQSEAVVAEARAIRERLHGAISSLSLTVDLMRARGLDTTRERQLLIRATGDVGTDILDRDVLVGLIQEGWANVSRWLTANAPRFLFNVFLFGVIVLAFHILARISGALVTRAMSAAEKKVPTLMKKMARSVVSKSVFALGILIGLSQLGLEVGPLIAGLGVAGFIVGFALQDSLSNFAAGMMILVYQPFDVGDVVEAGGVSGKVSHMSLVSTTVLTFDNQKLIVPNNKIWGGVIRNKTAEETRRVDLTFAIGANEDTARVEALLREIVEAHPAVLDEPQVAIKVHKLNESSYDVIVRPWVRTADYWSVYWDLTRTVKDRFEAEGIAKPFPKRDVRVVDQVPEAKLT